MSAFMQPQITAYQSWWMVETAHEGTIFLPAEDFSRQELRAEYSHPAQRGVGRRPSLPAFTPTITKVQGFGCRMSAPGYMDSTEWSVFETEAEAEKHLDEEFGCEFDDDEEFQGAFIANDFEC